MSAGVVAFTGFTLRCPQPEQAVGFCAALGVDASLESGTVVARFGPDAGHGIRFEPAMRKQLSRISFSCRPEDFSEFGGKAQSFAEHPAKLLIDPDGLEVEIVAVPGCQAPSGGDPVLLPHAPLHAQMPAARPLCLSHLAIFVTDLERSLAFYRDSLGLILSDRCGDGLAFLHAAHGSGHHVLALAKSGASGLHHYAFEMGTIDAIELRAGQATAAGYTAGWGFGRHVLGSNFFHYIRDPWDSHAELTAGLDFIPAGTPWTAGNHEPEDSMYLWGPPPPHDFLRNPEHQPPIAVAAAG